jgi:UDP-2-acetamido-3-amino-2,3-dideoxy-glucuronate N-acetyltransferase
MTKISSDFFYCHPTSDVQSNQVGRGTRIGQHSIVLPGATIGKECTIGVCCFIENDVTLGNNVTLKNGVSLWDGLRVGDDVMIGANASFANDRFPRINQNPPKSLQTILDKGTTIGAGAVILPGIKVGANAMVGAGAVVTRSVPPNAIVVGNPAKIIGYKGTQQSRLSIMDSSSISSKVGGVATSVRGVSLHKMKLVDDIRGSLTVGEFGKEIPFGVQRYFMVFDVPSIETRGEHAHRQCHQFLICTNGSCSVVADDGINRQEFLLNSPELGLYLPPMTWGIQYKYTDDAVLLVFASHSYDETDYIRDYSEFLSFVDT